MNRLNFEQEKQLIDYFRDNPSLWNTKDKDYNNRMLRTQKLETIASYLQLTRKDVYEKYRNLRTTFFREHKRVEQSIGKNGQLPPGEQAQLAYVSKWRHYQNMLFLTKVDKNLVGIKLEHPNNNNGNSLQNEDSTSNEQPMNHSHLNNGHDIELVIDTGNEHRGLNNNRPQLMDTSGDNDNSGAPGLVVQNATSSGSAVSNSLVNHSHLSNHSGEDLILINATGDGGTVNGGTAILTQNGIGIMNSRILTSNSGINRSNATTIVSISPSQNQHPPLTPTVIYTNHHLAGNGGLNGSLHRIKAETAADIQRHLASANNPTIIPVLSALPMQTALQLANQSSISLNLNQSHFTTAGLTSPHQLALATATPVTSLVGTKTSVNPIITSKNLTQATQLQQLQSTPINPASRKNSLLFFTRSQDHSPVVSSPTALTLENTVSNSPLEQSVVSVSPGSTFVHLNSGQLVNSISATSVSSNSTLSQQPQSPQQQPQLAISVPSTSTSIKSTTKATTISNSSNGSPTAIGTKVMDYTEMRECIKNVVQEAIVEYEDEEMAFCRSLAASLRTLDRSKKDVAKLELQQVIVRHTNPNYCNSLLNSYHNSGSCGNLMEEDNSARVNNSNNHSSTSNTVSTIMSNNSNSSKNTTATSDTNTNNSDNNSTKGQMMMAIDGDRCPSNGHRQLNKS